MHEGDDSDDQCFEPAKWQHEAKNGLQDLMSFSINGLLPCAKDLHHASKPDTMIPRTCFLELGMTQLPLYVDQGFRMEEYSISRPNIGRFQNPEKIGLQEFLNQHRKVYDKLSQYQQPSFVNHEKTTRFKKISHLRDFHPNAIVELPQYSPPQNTEICQDLFDSNIECGNLGLVYKNSDQRQYYLLLENDVNSHGYTSWFFFRFKPYQKGTIIFRILNLVKQPHLHKFGMGVTVFSSKRYRQEGASWFTVESIESSQTNFLKKNRENEVYASISFSYDVGEEEDELYFSAGQPYTYSRAIRQVQLLREKAEEFSQQVQIDIVKNIYSICHNIIPIIHLNKKGDNSHNKKSLIFMARQHPAEVVGSFLMEALMKSIFTQDSLILNLIQHFNIILFPMVNPDGVIHGNSRCNLAGLDLNRQWDEEHTKEATPETYGLRKYLWKLHETSGIHMLIDFHGHSKKMNSFFFCSKPEPNSCNYLLPLLASKMEPIFDFGSCTFNSTPDKKKTLRVQLNEAGMPRCYTLQNSYFGYWKQHRVSKGFQLQDYNRINTAMIEAIKLVSFHNQTEIKQIMLMKNKCPVENFDEEILRLNERIIKNHQRKNSALDAELESDSDPDVDIMSAEEMKKIYQEPKKQKVEELPDKNNKHLFMKRVKEKKKKVIKVFEQKSEDIRQSQPNPSLSEAAKKTITKIYASEKKLGAPEVKNANPTETQARFYSRNKHQIEKKKSSNRHERTLPAKQFTIGGKGNGLTEIKTKTLYSSFNSRQPNFEITITKHTREKSTQPKKISEITSYLMPQNKNNVQIDLRGVKERQERIKTFLNDTLSIARVGKPEPRLISSKLQYTPEEQIQMQSEQTRTKTENQQLKGFCSKKKIMRMSFQKQILKRKDKLQNNNNKEQNAKYQRFQNFMAEKAASKRGKKEQASSVFYYFPIL